MSPGNHHTITIDKVVAGGHGLARLPNGMVVMVPFVLPGESVVVAIGRQYQGYVTASVLEVVEPSPSRVAPLCPHFRFCGGCNLQHADYPCQLEIKSHILNELAVRAGIILNGVVTEPLLPSPDEFYYRQRIRLQIDSSGRVGFFGRSSHAVVEIDVCPLAVSPLNQTLIEIRRLSAFRALCSHSVALELLLNPLDGRVVVNFQLSRKPRPADQQAAITIASTVGLIQSVWLSGEGFVSRGPFFSESLREHADYGSIAYTLSNGRGVRDLIMRFEAGGFCQVNLRQNEQLVQQVMEWAQVKPEYEVLDLFCGMGNFSLPLALGSGRVVGSDLQRSSIRGAQGNALANQLDNCFFIRVDAQTAAQQLRQERKQFDVVLLDPPRQGCREIISLLPELCANKIIYISCDPATLVRDLRQLQDVGFSLCRLRGVDMFPQTCHLEAIALLVRD